MNLSKKIIGIILSVLMIVSVIPMAAFAADPDKLVIKSGADLAVYDDSIGIDMICGLDAEGMTVAQFKAQLDNDPADVVLQNVNGELSDNDYVTTFTIVRVNGQPAAVTILFGDYNLDATGHDGAIDGFDLFCCDSFINDNPYDYMVALDCNHDGITDINDYNEIRAQIAGEKLVDQLKALPKITIDEADAAAIGTVNTIGGEDITPDAAFDLSVNQTAADIAEARYADWPVDLILTFNKDVNAEDVYLFGNYGSYGWLGKDLTPAYTGTLAAGTEISILGEWLAAIDPSAGTIPYSYLVESVKDFSSAIYVDGAADGLEATVKLVMTDDEGTVRTIDTFTYTWVALPKAAFTPADASAIGEIPVGSEAVTPEAAFDLSTEETPAEIADKNYKDWTVDLVLTFNDAVNAEDVYLFGNYGSYGWLGKDLTPAYTGTLAAGTEIEIIGKWLNAIDSSVGTIPYSYVVSSVQNFASAIYVKDAAAGLEATVNLVMTDGEGNEYVIDTFTYSFLPKPTVDILDEAEIEAIAPGQQITVGSETIPVDTAVEVNFNDTYADAQNSEYADWNADVIVTFNKDIPADVVEFFGKFAGSGWLGGALDEDITAGEAISLVSWFLDGTSHSIDEVTYAEVVRRFNEQAGNAVIHIPEQYTDGLVVTVQIVLKDGTEVKVIADGTYTYLPKPTVDILDEAEIEAIAPGLVIPYGNETVPVDTAVEVEFTETYAEALEKEYAEWPADVIVTFNKDLPADVVEFFGQFAGSGWLGGPIQEAIAANDPISLVSWFLEGTSHTADEVTYAEVVRRLNDMAANAAIHIPAEYTDGLVVSVQIVLKDGTEVKVIADGTYTYLPKPTAKILDAEEIEAIAPGLVIPYGNETVPVDTAVEVEFTETYAEALEKEYAEWPADVIVTFNKDLPADVVEFFGQFAGSGWLGGPIQEAIAANDPISLVSWFLEGTSHTADEVTYAEVVRRLNDMAANAAIHIPAEYTDGLVVSVQIVLDNGTEKKIIADGEYVYIPEPTVAIVAPADVPGGDTISYSGDELEIDKAVEITFNETYAEVQTKEYADWNTDVYVTFNKDIDANTAYFFGKYGSSGWLGGAIEESIKAGEAINLVDWFLAGNGHEGEEVAYQEVLKRISDGFAAFCFEGDTTGLEVSVQIVVSDGNGNQRVIANETSAI